MHDSTVPRRTQRVRGQRRALLVIGALLTSTSFAAAAPTAVAPLARTAQGAVRGAQRDDLYAWYNLPFAAPPVGPLRWRPPRPVEPWTGVRDATHPGVSCTQDAPRGEAPSAAAGTSEDCLYLNVFSRAAQPRAKQPVMVWIHGGSFRVGSGADPAFDGAALTRAGVVLVTINYRLDRFGRFAHPALSAAQADEPLGNYALMDQVAALQWVRQNIGRFGGDPRNVTIFGCSAGGVSVDFLMAMPAARGLFQRAIAQSGSIVPEGERDLRRPVGRFPSLEQDGLDVAKHFGIAEDGQTLARLRALTSAQLLSYPQKDSSMNPVVDGRLVPEDPARAFAAGRQAPVPFMSGATSFEASLIRPFNLPLQAVLLNQPRAAAEAAYGLTDDEALKYAYFGDSLFLVSAYYLAGQMTRVRQPGYVYWYSYVNEAQRGRNPGAYHCSDTPRTFGTEWRDEPASDRDRAVGEQLRRYWTQFARTGKPDAAGLPAWPAHTLAAPVLLEIGATIEARPDPFPQRMQLHLKRFATP
jgi:para-nitrobenzyl esterase